MTTYTIAVREKGKSGAFKFIGHDLKVHDTANYCKPLSRDDAEFAKKLIVADAAKMGRPITCRIVRLCV